MTLSKLYSLSKLHRRSTARLRKLWDKYDFCGGPQNKYRKLLVRIEGILVGRDISL